MKQKVLLFFPVFFSITLLFGQEFSSGDFASSRSSEGCATGEEDILSSNDAYEYEVLAILNQIRLEFDLHPLKLDTNIRRASRYHAHDMSIDNYFNHDTYDRDANGELVLVCDTWDRVPQFYKYHGAAENIAVGYPTPRAVMDGWMKSEGHRKNILNPHYKTIGIGYVKNEAGIGYWVQNFGTLHDIFHVLIDNDTPETEDLSVNLYIQGEWVSMRLSNDAQNWSNWSNFANSLTWSLSNDANSQKNVYVEVMDNNNQIFSMEDAVTFTGFTTALNDLVTDPIKLYPNPIHHGNLTVEIPKGIFSQLMISDYYGRITTYLLDNQNQLTIPIDAYPTGQYYLLGIDNKGQILSIPFVKH